MPGGLPHSEIPGSTIARISPRAFRSVPRPSSPLSAKASTRCPSIALDHKARPPRGITQRITRNATRPGKPRTGASPTVVQTAGQPRAAARMKTLFSDDAPHAGSHPRPRPVRLGHIHKSSSPFNQHRLRGPARDFPRGNPRSAAAAPNFASPNRRTSQPNQPAKPPRPPQGAATIMEAPMVEVNGIEPMTSCLQKTSTLPTELHPRARGQIIRNQKRRISAIRISALVHLDGGPGRT